MDGPRADPDAGIVDLIEPDAAGGFDSYFDPAEFALRASLEDQHYWRLHRRGVLRDVIASACPDASLPLVELGCGVGTVATYLNEAGFHVDYADVHTEGLRIARERARARGVAVNGREARRFFRVDITRGLPPGAYGGALLLDVLEHLPDDRAPLRAVRGALRAPEGQTPFVLFTVPAFQMLWSPWDDVEKHKRRYTLSEARTLAGDTGFDVVRATYFFFPLFFAASAVKALRVSRDALSRQAAVPRFAELTETKNNPVLNRAMLTLLGAERRWLSRRDLPLGTSILVLATPRRHGA